MPSWVTTARTETSEDVAFLSGAALAQLHVVLGRGEVHHALLGARLALRACCGAKHDRSLCRTLAQDRFVRAEIIRHAR
ncbi:DUF1403 family protein [Primorskyibacter flagellatus]|uniref:Uncharacterized protein n=1 Tax=Primorskyibacter flagellatus TaxID=1387277 RepID=A0A1W2E0A9_9RHOB|nr:Protein of unknown function [Primorskyibacter flagellatus]